MHAALRITFQNTPSSSAIRHMIEQQADHLEQFFGRMTACDVHFKLPDGNHRSSGLYEVSIHIKMPGGMTVSRSLSEWTAKSTRPSARAS